MHGQQQQQQQPETMIQRSAKDTFSTNQREDMNHITATSEPPQGRLLPHSSSSPPRRRERVRYLSVSNSTYCATSPSIRLGVIVLLWLILVGSVPSIHGQPYQAPPQSLDNPTESTKYSWEDWNSYEILGLEDPSSSSLSVSSSALQKRQEYRTTLTHKEIRKAYRKQAQKWHPDKINNNSNNSNSTTTTGTTPMISVEESNARFARINEAHTVLTNPEAKLEYDNYLRYCEASHQQQSSSSSSTSSRYDDYSDWASSLFSQFSSPRNPFDMFEEYFFGSGGPTKYDNNNDDDEDNYAQHDSYFYGNHHGQQRQQQHSYGRPVRVYESQDIVYHANLGREVVRVTQTEEYAPDKKEEDGRFYYRVMAQDFLQVYDPYRGGLILQPVTQQPYLLDEGWKFRPSHGRTKFVPPPRQQQQQQNPQQFSQKHDHYSFQSSHTILVGDVLTPNSPLLTSPNGRYYAGLSPECQLLIFSDHSSSGKHKQQQQQQQPRDGSEDDKDDELIWSSPPLSPQLQQQQRQQRSQGQCFVMLRDTHLIVALGTPERPSHLLWYSDPDPRGPQPQQHGSNDKKYTSSHNSLDPAYVAQLDNDGALAVYRIETVPQFLNEYFPTNDKEDKEDEPKTPWAYFVSAALFGHPPRTKAAKAWVATRQWVASLVLAREYSGQFVRHKTCIHATGPMGCFRSARRLHQLARDGTFHVHSIVTKFDHALDQMITFFVQDDSEEDEENIYHRVFSSRNNNNNDSDKQDLMDRVLRKLYELKEEATLWARQGARVVREKFLDRLQAAGFP